MSRDWEDWAQHEQDHCPQLLTVGAVISHRCSRKGMSVLDNDESLSVSEKGVGSTLSNSFMCQVVKCYWTAVDKRIPCVPVKSTAIFKSSDGNETFRNPCHHC